MEQNASSTMVVQGRVILHKVPDILRGSCLGCFYINLDCSGIAASAKCTTDNHIWEVLEWHL